MVVLMDDWNAVRDSSIIFKNLKACIVILMLFLVVLRVSAIFFIHLPLNIEEMQYAVWSQHLAFGYHSKPPLIAWMIFISRHWSPLNELARVRFFSPFCYMVAALFTYMTAKHLFDRATAVWSMLTFYLLGSISFGSLLMTTDALLLLFWSAALYCLVRALAHPSWGNWSGVGFLIGMAALAKYIALLFILSLFLFLYTQKDKRYLLRTLYPYCVIFVSFFVLLPNMLWNMHHHFSTFSHVWHTNMRFSGVHFYILSLLNFFFSQFAVFSPVLFLPLIFFVFFNFKQRDYRYNLLRFFSGVILLAIFLQALFSHAYANWAVAAYISGIILVCDQLISQKKLLFLWINAYVMSGVLILFYLLLLIIGRDTFFQEHPIGSLIYGAYHREIISEVAELRRLYPRGVFVFDNRYAWAAFMYYGQLSYAEVYAYNQVCDFSPDTIRTLMPFSNNTSNANQYIYITKGTQNLIVLRSLFQVSNLNIAIVHLPAVMKLNVFLLSKNRISQS